MSNDRIAYKLGRLAGARPLATLGVIAAVAGAVALLRATPGDWLQPPSNNTPKPPATDARLTQLRAQCQATREDLAQQYRALMPQHPGSAANIVASCAGLTNDPTLQALHHEATVQHHRAIANDRAQPPETRLQSIDRLQSITGNTAQLAQARAAATADLDAARRKAAAAEKQAATAIAAQKRQEGISIGMTAADVLASSWGKPKHINTTALPNSTREQWVYGTGHYVYLRDGIVESIQTRR